MSRRGRPLAFLVLFLPLAACGFDAPAPKRLPPPPAPVPPLSMVSAKITIPAGEIARILDEKTENHLADVRNKPIKCAIGHCRLTLLATREGPIEARAEDGRLWLRVPFGIDAEMNLPGFLSMLRASGNAEGIAETETGAKVSRNWQLVANSDAHIQLDNSRLRLGPVKADFTDVLNNNEDVLARPLSRMLDREVEKSVHLRNQVERAWAMAFVPIRVAKNPMAWLVLAPERLKLSGPSVEHNALTLDLGLDVRARVVVQDKAPPRDASPLPPPSPLTEAAERFSFALPATISYADAAREALSSLEKKPPVVSGMPLRFTKLEFLPSRDDVVLLARVCVDQSWDPTGLLSACGTGYLRGIPVFDPETQSVRITHVRYDVLTENAVLAAMRELAGPEIPQALETRLTFSVSHDLAKLRDSVAKAIERPRGRDVTIAGHIDSFAAPSLSWNADGFVALFSASGTVHAEIRA